MEWTRISECGICIFPEISYEYDGKSLCSWQNGMPLPFCLISRWRKAIMFFWLNIHYLKCDICIFPCISAKGGRPRFNPFFSPFLLFHSSTLYRSSWSLSVGFLSQRSQIQPSIPNKRRLFEPTPLFWDSLSKHPLSPSVREFDWRTPQCVPPAPLVSSKKYLPANDSLPLIKRFCRQGGPSLAAIVGVCISIVDQSI